MATMDSRVWPMVVDDQLKHLESSGILYTSDHVFVHHTGR